jgi:hypothetical protein
MLALEPTVSFSAVRPRENSKHTFLAGRLQARRRQPLSDVRRDLFLTRASKQVVSLETRRKSLCFLLQLLCFPEGVNLRRSITDTFNRPNTRQLTGGSKVRDMGRQKYGPEFAYVKIRRRRTPEKVLRRVQWPRFVSARSKESVETAVRPNPAQLRHSRRRHLRSQLCSARRHEGRLLGRDEKWHVF